MEKNDTVLVVQVGKRKGTRRKKQANTQIAPQPKSTKKKKQTQRRNNKGAERSRN